MIETLDDIIEQLANMLGIYGSHPEDAGDNCKCRICFTMPLKERILRAVEVDAILAKHLHLDK